MTSQQLSLMVTNKQLEWIEDGCVECAALAVEYGYTELASILACLGRKAGDCRADYDNFPEDPNIPIMDVWATLHDVALGQEVRVLSVVQSTMLALRKRCEGATLELVAELMK